MATTPSTTKKSTQRSPPKRQRKARPQAWDDFLDPARAAFGMKTNKELNFERQLQAANKLRQAMRIVQNKSRNQNHNVKRSSLRRSIQSNVPLLKAKTPATTVVAQYLDPLNHEPVRLPDVSSAQTIGTAVCALSSSVAVDWIPVEDPPALSSFASRPDGTGAWFTNYSHRLAFKLRDPTIPLIVSEFATGTMPSSVYNILYSNELDAEMAEVIPIAGATLTLVPFTELKMASGSLRYPLTVPAATIGTARAIWLDASTANQTTLTVTYTTPSSADVVASLLIWTNDFDYTTKTSHQTGGTSHSSSFSLTTSGYYSVGFMCFNATKVTNLALTAEVTVQQWFSHYTHPSWQSTSAPCDVRVLGDCLLATNTAPELFKGGAVYAYQQQDNAPWYMAQDNPSYFTSVNRQELYQGNLSQGLYAVVKPQGHENVNPFAMLPVRASTSPSAPFLFRPFAVAGLVSILLVPPALSSEVSFTIHYMRTVEFTTDSQLFAVRPSTVPRAMIPTILDELSSCPQFFENPLHLGAIAAVLQRLASWSWANRSTIAAIVQHLISLSRRS